MKLIKYFFLVAFATFTCISGSFAQVSYEGIKILIEKEQYKEALNLTNDHLSRNKTDIKLPFVSIIVSARNEKHNINNLHYNRTCSKNSTARTTMKIISFGGGCDVGPVEEKVVEQAGGTFEIVPDLDGAAGLAGRYAGVDGGLFRRLTVNRDALMMLPDAPRSMKRS